MMDRYKIDEYLIRLLNNEISESDFIQLKEWMATDSNAISYYCMFLNDYVIVRRQLESEFDIQAEILADPEVLSALAQEEKTAPAIELPKEKQLRELVQKVVYPPREKRKLSTFNKVILAINVAAVLFFVLFLKFAPSKAGGIAVATLADSINAKWADTGISMEKGARLFSGRNPVVLREGLAEIIFDNNAKVTVEGPAEFQILDGDMVKLNYGQIYSQIPAEAYGFQVCTPYAKIIDLGTEFGVTGGRDGDTEVHVFKGKVALISSALNKKVNVDLLAGSARKLNVATGTLKEIPCNDDLFARQIDSRTNVVWRGQKAIDLADIVGGGNGFGTGTQGVGINPVSGVFRKAESKTLKHDNVYTPVESSVFIDGVFVPNGTEQQIVTTAGHVFVECPPTSGYFYTDISNTSMGSIISDEKSYPLYLNQTNYSLPENPSIFMHSNTGITFDLNQFRKRLPGTGIVRFQCVLGISDSAPKRYIADFWIAVDGRMRYSNIEPMRRGNVVEIDIAIDERDRFLTLMVTDGSVRGIPQDENAIGSDWGLFGRPLLILQ